MKENQKYFFKLILRACMVSFIVFIIGTTFSLLSFVPLKNSAGKLTLSIVTSFGNALIFLSPLLLGYLVMASLCKTYEMFFQQQSKITAKKIVSLIRNSLAIIFILFALNIIITTLQLKETYSDIANDVIFVIIIGTIAWTLLQILSIIESIIYTQYKLVSSDANQQKIIASYTKVHIIRNIASVFIIIIAIASAMMVFDRVRNIGVSLLASVGFLTAIAALAAQKTLSSLFIGLELVLSEPIKIGDLVVIENESGTIEEISLTFVVIKIWDSRRLILPISYFVEKPFQNWSRGTDGLFGVIKIEIGHTVPIDAVRTELNNIVENTSLWDRRVASLSLANFKEKTVEIRIIVSASNPGHLDLLSDEIREKLLKFFVKHCPDSLPK